MKGFLIKMCKLDIFDYLKICMNFSNFLASKNSEFRVIDCIFELLHHRQVANTSHIRNTVNLHFEHLSLKLNHSQSSFHDSNIIQKVTKFRYCSKKIHCVNSLEYTHFDRHLELGYFRKKGTF